MANPPLPSSSDSTNPKPNPKKKKVPVSKTHKKHKPAPVPSAPVSPAPVSPAPSTTATLATPVTGSEEQYELFLPLAQQSVADDDVIVCRADTRVAYHNTVAGLTAVLPFKDRAQKAMPEIDFSALEQMPNLALALIYAGAQVDGKTSGDDIQPSMERAREVRRLLLNALRPLVDAGIVPVAEYRRILKGRGSFDTAQDCVDLAAVFRKYAAGAEGKTAVTAELVQEAATLGTQLVAVIKSPKMKRSNKPTGDLKLATDARDKLWSLLGARWTDLWKVGAYFFGKEEVNENVPPLQSQARPPKAKVTAEAATDGAGSTAAVSNAGGSTAAGSTAAGSTAAGSTAAVGATISPPISTAAPPPAVAVTDTK